ncbi:MAG TPA: hypothetical protein VLN90_02935, partial [Thioalkalivibrio sp.]|nr:hypothetical protein [Thioalkalivibrio sp.]
MKKLLPFLIAFALLPAVALGASDDSNGAEAAVTDVPEDTGTSEGPPESVEDDEEGYTNGQSGMSGSDDTEMTTVPDAVSEDEDGGTQEGEARETPFDEEDQSTGQDGMSGSDSTDGATGMELGDDS